MRQVHRILPAGARLEPEYLRRHVVAVRGVLVQRPRYAHVRLHYAAVKLVAVVLAQRLAVDAEILPDLVLGYAIARQRLYLRGRLWRGFMRQS